MQFYVVELCEEDQLAPVWQAVNVVRAVTTGQAIKFANKILRRNSYAGFPIRCQRIRRVSEAQFHEMAAQLILDYDRTGKALRRYNRLKQNNKAPVALVPARKS